MNSPENNVRHLLLLFSALSFCALLNAQSTCEVWQWTGTDSANRKGVCWKSYNAHDDLVLEKMDSMITAPDYGPLVWEVSYQFRDTVLISSMVISERNDSSRMEFRHNDSGKVIGFVEYHRRYVLPDTIRSGMFTINIVPTDSADGRWVKSSDVNYTFDRWGRMIAFESFYFSTSSKSRFLIQYDEQGRELKQEFYTRDQKQNETVYEYFDGGHRYTRYWFNEKGKVIRKPGKDIWEGMLPRTTTELTDAGGRATDRRVTDRKGKQIEHCVMTYNAQGKMTREVFYDAEGRVLLTHVYVYR